MQATLAPAAIASYRQVSRNHRKMRDFLVFVFCTLITGPSLESRVRIGKIRARATSDVRLGYRNGRWLEKGFERGPSEPDRLATRGVREDARARPVSHST